MPNNALIQIKVNGQARTTDPATTLTGLLQQMGMALPHLAVALNDEVVPHSQHPETVLRDGDTVEIIRAVAGG